MKIIYIVFWGVLLSLGIFYQQVVCLQNDTEDMEGRAQYGRKMLNIDITSVDLKPDTLRCGDTYSVAQEGYVVFQLDSRKSCHYSFIGSKTAKCTATIYCNGKFYLAPSKNGKCEEEVFAVSDGTEGFMSGCGTFHFGGIPRKPRNKGKDLYLYYKGKSTTATCIVFCLEDLKDIKTIKPAKPVSLNKKYKGLETDKSCVCGRLNDEEGRIVGGTSSIKFEFPWMTAIAFKGEGRLPFCGGAIVNNRYVVTAAHCFILTGATAEQIELVLHAHIMDKHPDRSGKIASDDDPAYKDIPGWALPRETDKSENSIRIEAESVTVHPLFDRKFDFDVAIIKLKSTVNFTKSDVSPICLPNIEDFITYADGENFLVTGWGKVDENGKAGARILQKLEVPFVNLDNCKKYTKPTDTHICAGFSEGGKDACQGDSGGPLIHKSIPGSNQYVLSGVVSAGKGCARREKLGLYGNIQEFAQWIYYHMDDAVWCPR